MNHSFVWYDLMTTDVQAAKRFYGAVVGWEYTEQGAGYFVANVGKTGVAGITALPANIKGVPPFWSGYIQCQNVDQTCKQLQQMGGAIHKEPWEIPGMLRMAVVADPTGANFNLMQPLSSDSQQPLPEGTPGTAGWNELHAGDHHQAWQFYSQLFGWKKSQTIDMGEMGGYDLINVNGQDTVGMMQRQSNMPMPVWVYYFFVDGIEAAEKRLTVNGGTVVFGPEEVPGGQWIINATDPQGGFFALVSNTRN